MHRIAEYDTWDVRSFLKISPPSIPMREAVAELNDAIARLLVRPEHATALAADFAGLFLSAPGQSGAQPYESSTGAKQAADAGPMTEMQARLDRSSASMSATNYNEPADHLAIGWI